MFEPRSEADIIRLVTDNPLAWVVSPDDPGFAATPLPLLPETDEAGNLLSLLGHFALSNPQVATLQRTPEATILFMGPQGYISPEHVSNPGWIPTWNYAAVRFDVRIAFVQAENDAALARLVETMERDRPSPWPIAAAGDRYAGMAARIIAFRAHILRHQARFKLGQDERPGTRREIIAGLGDSPLGRIMADFDEGAST